MKEKTCHGNSRFSNSQRLGFRGNTAPKCNPLHCVNVPTVSLSLSPLKIPPPGFPPIFTLGLDKLPVGPHSPLDQNHIRLLIKLLFPTDDQRNSFGGGGPRTGEERGAGSMMSTTPENLRNALCFIIADHPSGKHSQEPIFRPFATKIDKENSVKFSLGATPVPPFSEWQEQTKRTVNMKWCYLHPSGPATQPTRDRIRK